MSSALIWTVAGTGGRSSVVPMTGVADWALSGARGSLAGSGILSGGLSGGGAIVGGAALAVSDFVSGDCFGGGPSGVGVTRAGSSLPTGAMV